MKEMLVKILATLAIILFLTVDANAQNIKPVALGINAGGGLSNINNGKGENGKIKFAYQLGLSMDIAFTPNVYLLTGAEFAVKGAKRDIEAEEAVTDFDISAQYIQVPLYLGCKFDIVSSDSRVVFAIGPYFAYGIGGKTNIKQRGSSEPSEKIDTFKDDLLKPFDWGFGCRIGLEYRKIHFGVTTNLGLADISKQGGEMQRMASACMVFGYLF